MAYQNHEVVKDQVIADAGIEILGEKLDILNSFTKFSPDQYFGADGDTVSVRVKGTMPVRHYGFRNDRSQPIRTDVYKETKVDLTVSAEDAYSSAALTDEQKKYEMDGSFGRLTDAQTDAIAEDTHRKALHVLQSAPFEACLALDPSTANIQAQHEIGRDYIYNKFVQLAQILTKLRAPAGERYARVGSTIAAELRMNNKLIQSLGDPSGSALTGFNVGQFAGFNIVEDPFLPDDEGFIYVKSAYQFWNFAPAVPEGAVRGATTNKNGVAMTWIVDYDSSYQVDRSTWKTWRGWNFAKDMLKQVNSDETQIIIGKEQYFLRGAKIKLGAESEGFLPGDGGEAIGGRKGAAADSELGLVFAGKPFVGSLPEGNSHDYSRVDGGAEGK